MSQTIEGNIPNHIGTALDKTPSSTNAERSNLGKTSGARFHDLDALRASAMLLGIVLHAAMSFGSIPWPVKDSQQSEEYTYLFAVIHGFRMPLFFMLSGFFTAMLWRKRGLAGLIRQRSVRIGIPLLIGCLTIIPSMWAIGYYVSQTGAATVENPSVWQAIISGDSAEVERAIASGEFDVNSVSVDGASALTVAVFLGHEEVAKILIEGGANVNQVNGDGGTALHSAAFVGRSTAAEMLLAAGANPKALNPGGQTPGDLLRTDLGTTMFLAGSFGLQLDEEQLLAERAEIAQQLDVEDYLGASGTTSGVDLNGLYGLFFQLPVFMHLWFLSFLCWLLVPFALFAGLSNWLPKMQLPRWLVNSPASLLWLIPLTMIPQAWMGAGIYGPDASVGLLPIPSVLAYYAVFFMFGAIYWEAEDRHGGFGRYWYIALILGGIVFSVGYAMVSGGRDGKLWGMELPHSELLASLLEAVFAWLMIYGTIGLCRAFLSSERPRVRYLSDSSYWLYLIHLPLVMLGQYWVRDWAAPTAVKFVTIVVGVIFVLLVSYEWCVRYTAIGRVLHGPRHRTSRIARADAAS
ncbi:MAG: acyltransferase family protein [Planctomycetota bacterium]